MPERRPPGAPDISVVIPARDEEAFVATALASLETQRLPLEQLEAMVVANGCADRTADAVRTFAAQHPDLRLRLVELPTASVSAAKNRGAAEARGHLLLFLDADSRVAPDLLSTIWARATAGERAASIRLVGDTADALDRAFFRLIELKTLFGIRANMLYCERELFLDVGGFDETLHQAEDRDLLVRLQRRGIAVGHVSETWIATSPRRLHALPFRLAILTTFWRWTLGQAGIGRRWPY
jgi:glycosyltransferase involved in cell wall biosynthesis